LRELAERFDALAGRLLPKPNTCETCGCAPGFCAASRAADADPVVQLNRKNATADLPSWWNDDGVSPERLAGWFADRHRKAGAAPQSTMQAAEYLRRIGDVERFNRFLAGRSAQEKTAIIRHLESKKVSR